MKIYSQRRSFTLLMTFLATLSGTAFGVYELRFQPDIVSDTLKISGLLAISSMCVSYIFWTLTHLKKDSVLRGGLAGLLSGLAIVPVPYFTSALKREVLRTHNADNRGILISVLEAIPSSVKVGLETFQLISKVSLLAVIFSVILGLLIAKKVQPRSDETTLTPR